MTDMAHSVWTPAQVRELDRHAIARCGIPGYELMTRAGQAAFRIARERWPEARRWVVLCGAGNNAGDGFVVARLARAANLDVSLAALSDPAQLQGDAATAWRDYEAAGGTTQPFSAALISDAELVIDALLGTGLQRPVSGEYLAAIETVNAEARPVLALDVPSGLDSSSGAVLGAAVWADLTVTFVGQKAGLYLGSGPEYCGEIEFAGLDIPASVVEQLDAAPLFSLYGRDDLLHLLPPRPANAHKGNFGHVLIVGGDHGMSGAVRLAGEAALRAGAGLVTVATRPDHALVLPLGRPELMCAGMARASDLEPLLERATIVACGPGLGRGEWARDLFDRVVGSGLPLVLDADALNLLADRKLRRDDWILTPHPGEAGRLLGSDSRAVQADRFAALNGLCREYGGTVILKGRGSLVGRAGSVPVLIDRGNPGMATAGMGDVLTGLVAGLVAQTGATDVPTAAGAAFIHAAAGDAAALTGERGLLASDLFAQFRTWLNPAH
ncbi:MAG: NAD(P)H-hydrate dehydratase [Gammaproteobacteria bacterium]|nr:NAD(P)H-hydrate dehydratase [Gammaproteobacteria bacterium]